MSFFKIKFFNLQTSRMLCSLMHYLTSFIFGTTFAVIDYIDDDINKSLNITMTFERIPSNLRVHYLAQDRRQKTTFVGAPIFYRENTDIVIDLVKLRYVQRVFIDCDIEDMEVFVENVLSRKLSKCIPEFRGARCRSLVRRVVIRRLPLGCAPNVLGYTSHINWYIGCIKSEYANYTTNTDTDLTIYEHCTFVCNENDYIGLFMVENDTEACKCFSNIVGLVSVSQEFCWKSCAAFTDFCGGEDPYISLYKSERSKETPPATWECIYTNLTCQPCDFGWRGYNCELSDCGTNEGNCWRMNCQNLTVWGELFRTCSCPDGFTMTDILGDLDCSDIDECAIESICPEGQICKNNGGSFECNCQVGYQKVETGDCTDLDECNTVSETFCDALSTICSNSDGSYSCRCRDGFRSDDVKISVCQDINECAIESICPEGLLCGNTIGSFACDCRIGYQKSETGACTDLDECNTVSETFCDVLSTICSNSDGSYSCKCRDGFRSDGMTINVCQDLDECMSNPCDRTSTNCRNTPGSFECSCFRGYHKIGFLRCEDDDECGSLFRKCPIGVPCVNLPGEYECYCPNGTKQIVYFHGTVCEDIDECLDVYICDQTSSFCVNAIMSYACICRSGFVKVDNFTCRAQDASFTEESQTASSEILTNEPAEESRTSSNAFYFGLGFLIILCMFTCLGCLCIAALKAKSIISHQSSASSVEMEVHEEENFE